jgi:DNA-binding PadR family transcriptional regulator
MSTSGPDAGNASDVLAQGSADAERTAPEYALLGLLARTETGEIHGYDLARVFGDGVLGQIVRLEPGMLYHYLKKLARAGLIATRVERQSGRPDRQVHRITLEGDSALRAWIAAPVRSTREIRLEFLLKLYLARQIDPDQARRLVAGQQRVMRSRVERLAKQVATAQPDSPDNAFGETVLRLRLSQTEAALAWLATLDEAHDTPPSP